MILNSVVPLKGGEEEIPNNVEVKIMRLDVGGEFVNLKTLNIPMLIG